MSDAVLPPEILDYYILDLLHNEPETLKQCCLVSRLWAPRIRKYLMTDSTPYSVYQSVKGMARLAQIALIITEKCDKGHLRMIVLA